jgi:exodeoxyribonuclease-1
VNFVFFDTETSGLNRSFDQIVQFGAIRTDDQLNEIEQFEIKTEPPSGPLFC